MRRQSPTSAGFLESYCSFLRIHSHRRSGAEQKRQVPDRLVCSEKHDDLYTKIRTKFFSGAGLSPRGLSELDAGGVKPTCYE